LLLNYVFCKRIRRNQQPPDSAQKSPQTMPRRTIKCSSEKHEFLLSMREERAWHDEIARAGILTDDSQTLSNFLTRLCAPDRLPMFVQKHRGKMVRRSSFTVARPSRILTGFPVCPSYINEQNTRAPESSSTIATCRNHGNEH